MKNLILLFLVVFLFSCEKDNVAINEGENSPSKKMPIICNIKDPVNNLAWLRDKVDDFKKSNDYLNDGYIMNIWVADYKGQELIVVYVGNEYSNGVAAYYTCNGKLYCDYTGNKACPDYHEFTNKIVPNVKFHTFIRK